jgi:small subunit ribosomal protein S19
MAFIKKRTFVHYKLDKKVQENIAGGNKGVVKTWSRAMILQTLLDKLSQFITSICTVYVTENMVGHKWENFHQLDL